MTDLSRGFIPLALSACLLFSGATGAAAQGTAGPEEFTAFAINMGALTSGTTANLIITVNRWSTQNEQDRFLEVLRAKGPDGLLEAFRHMPRLGSLRTAESVGYELRFATQEPLPDGGRRILIATDRPLGFSEAANRTRTSEYPFTVIEMQVPAEGHGSGTLSLAARIIPTGKNIVVENYDTQPIRLNRVESRKLKK
jgi:hypothetical protein